MRRTTRAMIAAVALGAGLAPSFSSGFMGNQLAYGCLPPEPPFVPQSDEDFREYVDVISISFEQYYSRLTEYFRCVDEERQAVFEQAREIGRLHQEFYARADRLGVRERAAVPHNLEN